MSVRLLLSTEERKELSAALAPSNGGRKVPGTGPRKPVVSPGEELMEKVEAPCRFPAADTGRILYQISDEFISDCFKTLITT